MISMLQKRLHDDEDGFTLIELMVVVLIIAILLAIAIPTFLGAQNRARDRGTQSDLRNGITAAKTIATDDAGVMTNVDVSSLRTAEGALKFASTGSDTDIGVVRSSPTADAVVLYKKSPSGTWFGIKATSQGKVTYCKGSVIGDVNATPAIDTVCQDPKW
jgi:type IV pilus assembly protein PilA